MKWFARQNIKFTLRHQSISFDCGFQRYQRIVAAVQDQHWSTIGLQNAAQRAFDRSHKKLRAYAAPMSTRFSSPKTRGGQLLAAQSPTSCETPCTA